MVFAQKIWKNIASLISSPTFMKSLFMTIGTIPPNYQRKIDPIW